MKILIILSFLLTTSLASMAQNLPIPQTDFELGMSNDFITVHRGDSTEVKLYILKSKGFAKAKTILKLNQALPKGIQIKISPDRGIMDQSSVKILVSNDAKPGKISLIIAAEMRLISKGIITTFEVL